MSIPLTRAASRIAGTGLFAGTDIAAGTPVPEAVDVANHACEPNLGWSGGTLAALCEIAAGTELVYDYATAPLPDRYLLRCHCASTRCRGMIEDDDWCIPQLRHRYAGHWHPDVQRRIDDET
jgi:hypothetical protein